jgi:hypothetical protein
MSRQSHPTGNAGNGESAMKYLCKSAFICGSRFFLLGLLIGLPFAALATAPPPHLELDIDLDPATRQLVANTTLTVEGEKQILSLAPGMTLTALVVDGRPRALPANPSGSLRIDLDGPGRHQLQLGYRGQLAPLPDLDHRGVLARLPPMADIQGSYLPAGSGWYPDPGVPFSYRLRLQLPAGQKGLVPGTLVRESDGEVYRAEFDFPHPTEGIDLMAGPYQVAERMVERSGASPLRVRTYFYADMADLAEAYLADSARYLERYSKAIGAYPFDAFSVVASPLPTGFRHAQPHLSRPRRAAPALHPRHLARARGTAQLVGQRRLAGLGVGQLVGRAHHLHGRLRLPGRPVARGGADRPARLAARPRRRAGGAKTPRSPPSPRATTDCPPSSATTSRRCCS